MNKYMYVREASIWKKCLDCPNCLDGLNGAIRFRPRGPVGSRSTSAPAQHAHPIPTPGNG
jgi:hypothetical protein